MAGRLAHGRLAEQRNPLRIMRLRYRAGAYQDCHVRAAMGSQAKRPPRLPIQTALHAQIRGRGRTLSGLDGFDGFAALHGCHDHVAAETGGHLDKV